MSYPIVVFSMTVYFYVKTSDSPKIVGDVVCAYNTFEDAHPKGKYTWVMEHSKSSEEYWLVRGKSEEVKDETSIAVVYKVGDAVVLGEIKDDYVPNFADPLLEKYGLDTVKWIVVSPKKSRSIPRPLSG